jgi:TonB family protein
LADLVDMDRLKRDARDVAAMYDTYSRIVRSAFPNKSFYNIPSDEDFGLQEQGSRFIAELRSGKFDAGLSGPSMAEILGEYRGIHADGQEPRTVVQVIRPSKEEFIQYAEPMYPRLARAARIQGDVEVDVDVDESGQVRKVLSMRGHPLLQDSAREAAVRWYFPSPPKGSPEIRVVLKYVIGGGCE